MHPQLSEIIKILNNKNSVLLLGQPASGKSVLGRLIAYDMLHNNKPVCFLQLKETQNFFDIKNVFEEIVMLSKESNDTLLIIEDAHLRCNEINQLISKKTPEWPKLLIITRDSFKNNLSEFEINHFDDLTPINLKASDQFDEIIELFFKHNPHNHKESLKTRIMEITQKNLWLLSYALESINESTEDRFEREAIIKEVGRELNNLSRINSLYASMLITLSILSQFEIPTDVTFLYKNYPGYKKNEIDEVLKDLSKMGEIIETNFEYRNYFYGIPHSELANLYLSFLKNSKWLETFFYKDEDEYISNYIADDSVKISHDLIKEYHSKKTVYGLGEKGLINTVVSSNNFIELFQKTKGYDIRYYIEYIELSEDSLQKRLSDLIDLQNYAKIIAQNSSLYDYRFINFILRPSPEKEKEFWELLQKEKYIDKINKSNYWKLSSLGLLLKKIHRYSAPFAERLWSSINKQNLINRLHDRRENIMDVMFFSANVLEIFKTAKYDLWDKLNIQYLAKRFEASKDIEELQGFLSYMYYVNQAAGRELWSVIDKPSLVRFFKNSTPKDEFSIFKLLQTIYIYSKKDGDFFRKEISKELNQFLCELIGSDTSFHEGITNLMLTDVILLYPEFPRNYNEEIE
jgi:hypothetical protein